MVNLAKASSRQDEPSALALVPRLSSIARSARQLLQLKLGPLGVLVGQDHLLTVLDDAEPRSILAIARQLNVRPSTVSKMMDHLEENGWAVREATQQDRRVTHVRLTPAGVAVREEVLAIWTRLDEELLGEWGAADGAGELMRGVATASAVLEARLHRLR